MTGSANSPDHDDVMRTPTGAIAAGPWGRTWLLALLLLAGLIASLEIFFRSRGHRPSVVATVQLWAYHRDRLEGVDRDTIGFVGGSRMMIDLVPDVFAEVHPGRPLVQLAVPAKGAFATIRDLAADESFAGTLICSLEELTMQPDQLEGQQDYIEYYRKKWGPGNKVSLLISAALQQWLVLLQPRLGGRQLLEWVWRTGRLPLVSYTTTRFDRYRVADYSMVNTQALIDTRIRFNTDNVEKTPPSEAAWGDAVAKLASYFARIEARGGKVVVVKLPIDGEFVKLTDRFFPRDRYWDTLAANIGVPVIHYEEMPGWEKLECPDDSHLDTAGCLLFTRWLAEELKRRDLVD